jgi:hypothetical protein
MFVILLAAAQKTDLAVQRAESMGRLVQVRQN